MNTITMTWPMFLSIERRCSTCDNRGGCSPSTCPIWRRAERKAKEQELRSRHPLAAPPIRTLAEAKAMVFGPVPTVVDGVLKPAKAVVGRSGSPLTRKGKIVRLPKKRTCKNCGDKGCNMNGRFHTLSCKNGWKPRRG